jgi:glyoxylase-like metal-dependent hydrolase (beta-lactamase superfamily II)
MPGMSDMTRDMTRDVAREPAADTGGRARLEFPFEIPERAAVREVAPGVLWIRLPMPGKLNHINVWALADEGGYAIVDTGMRFEETAAVWSELLAGPLAGAPVTRVFVTHMHPDHIGMAGWLTRRFGVRLWTTRLEYITCRMLVSDTGREAPADAIAFYRRAGWGEGAIEAYRARFGNFGKHIHALPDSFRRIEDGEAIRIGAHHWRVLVGTGHSPEHACLYCAELSVLISGDQLLPKISSNVSVHPTEPEADPMADWLASLAKLRDAVPAGTLVLPAHNECFRGAHERIGALIGGQERALSRLRDRLATPRRVIDLFGALFARQIGESDFMLLGLATGETLACLNYLLHRGEVRVASGEGGVNLYRLAGM